MGVLGGFGGWEAFGTEFLRLPVREPSLVSLQAGCTSCLRATIVILLSFTRSLAFSLLLAYPVPMSSQHRGRSRLQMYTCWTPCSFQNPIVRAQLFLNVMTQCSLSRVGAASMELFIAR